MNPTWIYVGGVYALGVYLARRLHADFPWRIAALFYALVLICLFRPMTGPYVNLPVDFLTMLPPWGGAVRHDYIRNYELNDVVTQMIPWANQVRSAYLHGKMPLWNALSGSGYPLLGNGQSAGMSPIRLLMLPLPLGYSFTGEGAMKMLIASSFMFGFCRRRWSELPSAVGAVCFGTCTFIQVWLHFPHSTTAAWLPAAILSLELLIERQSPRRIAGTASAWAALLLSGHPETAAHTAFLALMFVIWVFFAERRMSLRALWRPIAALAVAMVLCVLIASPFLVPFAETIRKSKRYQELQSRPNAVGYFRDWPAVVLLFQPDFFGHIPEDKAWPQTRAESITAFAGILGIGAWLSLLIRAIKERRYREREMFFVIITPIILSIILAWPGVSTLFHLLFRFAANDRLRLVLCWTSAALTAAILDLTLREGPRYLLIGNAAAATTALILINVIDFPRAAMKDIALLGMIPSLIVLALCLLFVFKKYRLQVACVVFAAVVAEVWSATRNWNPVLPLWMMYPSTPLIRFVQTHADPNHFRVTATGGMFFPHTPEMYGIADIRVHDPMANGRYLGLLRSLADYKSDDYFERWVNTDTKLLDYLNVKYVMTERPDAIEESARYRLVYDGKDGLVFENRNVLPRFFPVTWVTLAFRQDHYVRELMHHDDWADRAVVNTLPVDSDAMRQDFLHQPLPNAPRATLSIVSASDTDYTMRVHAPRHTLVVSSIPFWQGWRVERNGKTVLTRPVNGAFLGYVVPPGDSVVRVYFHPTWFYLALAISAMAVAATIGMSRLPESVSTTL